MRVQHKSSVAVATDEDSSKSEVAGRSSVLVLSDATMDKRRKIKNFWLMPAFQMKFVMVIFLTGFLFAACYIGFFYFYVWAQFKQLIQFANVTADMSGVLKGEMLSVFQLVVVVSIGFVFALLWVAIILSHRAAGPMYRFKKTFEQIRGGDMAARIHLRPHDDFQDVAQEFNLMMDQVQK